MRRDDRDLQALEVSQVVRKALEAHRLSISESVKNGVKRISIPRETEAHRSVAGRRRRLDHAEHEFFELPRERDRLADGLELRGTRRAGRLEHGAPAAEDPFVGAAVFSRSAAMSARRCSSSRIRALSFTVSSDTSTGGAAVTGNWTRICARMRARLAGAIAESARVTSVRMTARRSSGVENR